MMLFELLSRSTSDNGGGTDVPHLTLIRWKCPRGGHRLTLNKQSTTPKIPALRVDQIGPRDVVANVARYPASRCGLQLEHVAEKLQRYSDKNMFRFNRLADDSRFRLIQSETIVRWPSDRIWTIKWFHMRKIRSSDHQNSVLPAS